MKVKIVNVLGDWKISTETGAFYPGAYPTYEDAANKCERNGFEIVRDGEKPKLAPAQDKQAQGDCNVEGMAAMMGKMRDLPEVKIYPGRIKWDVWEMFTESQRKRLITAQEAADILGCSSAHIAALIDEGRISALNISSRNALRKVWRIIPAGVSDLILKSLCGAPEDFNFSDVPQGALKRLRDRIDEHLTAALEK